MVRWCGKSRPEARRRAGRRRRRPHGNRGGNRRHGRICPRHRPGHHLDAGDRLRRRAEGRRRQPAGVPAALSATRAGSSTTRRTCGARPSRPSRAALAKAGVAAGDLAGVGITNQRETTVVWDRATGKPIHNAIVWQDRRTADVCARLRADGHEAEVAARTGLLARSLFFGHEGRLAARQGPGRPGARRARRARLRHGRQLPASGVSPAARRMRPTRPTRRGRCCIDIRAGRWDDEPPVALARAGGDAAGGQGLRGGVRR